MPRKPNRRSYGERMSHGRPRDMRWNQGRLVGWGAGGAVAFAGFAALAIVVWFAVRPLLFNP